MRSYDDLRSELSGALLNHVAKRLQSMGFLFESGGSLLTPDAKKISLTTPPATMAIVQHFYYWRVNQPRRYVAVVFSPTAQWRPQVSIMSAPDRVGHTTVITDDDLSASIAILTQLLDETIDTNEQPRF